jgi:hypothetical protein
MPVRELKLSLDLSALRDALNLTEAELPDDATDETINELLTANKAAKPPEPTGSGGDALVPKQDPPKNDPPLDSDKARTPVQVPGGLVVDAEMWRETQEELATVRADREKRERNEDAEFYQGCGATRQVSRRACRPLHDTHAGRPRRNAGVHRQTTGGSARHGNGQPRLTGRCPQGIGLSGWLAYRRGAPSYQEGPGCVLRRCRRRRGTRRNHPGGVSHG